MSIFYVGASAYTPNETRAIIDKANETYHDILKFFWISEPYEAETAERNETAEHNFTAKSMFLIQWNKEGGSEFIPKIPRILHEAFGKDKLLVFDLNRDLVG